MKHSIVINEVENGFTIDISGNIFVAQSAKEVISKLSEMLESKQSGNVHNPDNVELSDKEIKQGWRLLEKDEIKYRKPTHHIECYSRIDNSWNGGPSIPFVGDDKFLTYRTKLSRTAIAKLN